jgi:rhomboid protease GluP
LWYFYRSTEATLKIEDTVSLFADTTASALDKNLASDVKVYRPRSSKQWWLGVICLVVGLMGLGPLINISRWLSGGPAATGRTFVASLCLLALPFGLLIIANALRGLPRLTIAPDGVRFDNSLGAKWANWDSLSEFELKTTYVGRFRKEILTATAKIIGPNTNKSWWRRSKSFFVPDHFQIPITEIIGELNAARAPIAGVSEPAAVREELPVGLAEFKVAWLTLALIAVMVLIFIAEIALSSPPATKLSPSVSTLIAMGGLSRTAVLTNGEWYRLFTSPLLHASLAHILGNGFALVLGGWILERLVGRLWYFALFTVGALGGALMSLALGFGNVVSVGASGALMALFAALFVASFHLPSGSLPRQKLQKDSLRILIPSLLPFLSSSADHIDYGAHLGGTLTGAAMGAILLRAWPETQLIPQLRKSAAVISIVGAALFLTSAGLAAMNYSKHAIALIPPAEIPKNLGQIRAQDIPDMKVRFADLVTRYPDDPRSHFYLGEILAAARDYPGAEQELRIAEAKAKAARVVLGWQSEMVMRSVLAEFLAMHGKRDEAIDVARPVCSAPAGDPRVDNVVKVIKRESLCGPFSRIPD